MRARVHSQGWEKALGVTSKGEEEASRGQNVVASISCLIKVEYIGRVTSLLYYILTVYYSLVNFLIHTQSLLLWKASRHAAINNNCTQISTTIYSQVFIRTAE